MNRHDVQAVVQVLAKAAGVDLVEQVAVAGGDDAGVDADRVRVADALELALLQHAQQLHLQLGRRGVDFVEEDRAGVGGFEAAGAVVDGAGERAADVAEQFAFEQALAERAAVDADERAVAARLSSWTALAISSLPVPVSPSSSTDARLRATCRVMR